MSTTLAIPLIKGNIVFREIIEVKYIAIKNSICQIYMVNGEKLNSSKSIRHYNKALEGNLKFHLFSRSLLVCISSIRVFNNRNQELILKDGTLLFLSRRGAARFKKYIEKNNFTFDL